MHLSVFIYNQLWKGIRSAHFFFLAKYCLLMLLQTSQNQRLPFSTTAIYINQCKFSECNNFFTTGFISPSSDCFFFCRVIPVSKTSHKFTYNEQLYRPQGRRVKTYAGRGLGYPAAIPELYPCYSNASAFSVRFSQTRPQTDPRPMLYTYLFSFYWRTQRIRGIAIMR